MNHQRCIALGMVGILALHPDVLHAQEDGPACANAIARWSQVDAAGRFGPRLAALQSCPDQGPQILAALWARPPEDRNDLAHLMWASGQLHDSRIANAVRTVFAESTERVATRMAALEALVMQTAPCLALGTMSEFEAGGKVGVFALINILPHDYSRRGGAFQADGRLDRLLSALDEVGSRSDDSVMSRRSAALAINLRRQAELGPLGCQ
jgi:hypothetical protein